jgi:hypothetical protein
MPECVTQRFARNPIDFIRDERRKVFGFAFHSLAPNSGTPASLPRPSPKVVIARAKSFAITVVDLNPGTASRSTVIARLACSAMVKLLHCLARPIADQVFQG